MATYGEISACGSRLCPYALPRLVEFIRHGGVAHPGFRPHHLPCRHGRLLRLGGRTLRSFAERQSRRGRRTAPRTWGGLGGILCGAQVRSAFGHAAANRREALSAGHLRRWTSRALPRVLGKSLQSAGGIFAAGGNGFDRRSLSRHDGHGAAARPAAESRAQTASADEGGNAAELFDRHRIVATDREGFVRTGQAERRAVDRPRRRSRSSSRLSTCARFPASAR